MIARRSILTGLVALVTAPAIVRAGSLMPVNVTLQPWQQGIVASLPTIHEITRGAVKLFQSSNVMLQEIDREFEADRAFAGVKIGSVLRIRLPNDFVLSDGPGMNLYDSSRPTIMTVRRVPDPVPQVPDRLAFAAAAVAIAPIVLAKPVTRRFWASKV